MTEPDAGLSRSIRIRHRPEFEEVYDRGVRVSGRFMMLFVLARTSTMARLGVAATRKLGSAVERNRAKRLARELFRRSKQPEALDIVIVPRRDMLDAPFASLDAEYRQLLSRRHQGQRGRSRHPRRSGGSGNSPRV